MIEPESDFESQRIVALLDQEVRAVGTGDIYLYLALLTDDAVFLPPNSPEKVGAGLREWLRDFLRRFKAEWLNYAHGKTIVSGDLACHRFDYTWRITPVAGGEPVIGTGKGLHVLRRQADASWKLAYEIWNSVPK